MKTNRLRGVTMPELPKMVHFKVWVCVTNDEGEEMQETPYGGKMLTNLLPHAARQWAQQTGQYVQIITRHGILGSAFPEGKEHA